MDQYYLVYLDENKTLRHLLLDVNTKSYHVPYKHYFLGVLIFDGLQNQGFKPNLDELNIWCFTEFGYKEFNLPIEQLRDPNKVYTLDDRYFS